LDDDGGHEQLLGSQVLHDHRQHVLLDLQSAIVENSSGGGEGGGFEVLNTPTLTYPSRTPRKS